MEWNAKTPSLWDWENFIMLNGTTSEIHRKLGPTDWEFEKDVGLDTEFLNPSGIDGRTCGSGTGLGFSVVSNSANSISSSIGEIKTSKFTLEAYEGAPKNCSSKNEFAKTEASGTSPTFEASFGSKDPLLGLRLGKRTYFEDFCVGNNMKASTKVAPVKSSKLTSEGLQMPRCQVEGCNLDLSLAKDYHRKHRVCENHSKYPRVIIGSVERRFCQQCSRFHSLSEFDGKKRSCRRRLSDHNARRRKPPKGTVQFSPASINGGEQHMSHLVWNRLPVVHTSADEKVVWEGVCSSKSMQTKGLMLDPDKFGSIGGQLQFQNNQFPNSANMHHEPNEAKDSTSEDLNQDLHEISDYLNLGTTQDFHRALSLLSTTSWGSGETKHVSLEHQTNIPQPSMPQLFPLTESKYWRTEHQPVESHMQKLASHADNNSHFREFVLSQATCEGDFYYDQHE